MKRQKRLFIATGFILIVLTCESIGIAMHHTGLLPTWDNLEIIIPDEYQDTLKDEMRESPQKDAKKPYCINRNCSQAIQILLSQIQENTTGLKTRTYRVNDKPENIIKMYHSDLTNKSYSLYNNTMGDTIVFGCPLCYSVYTRGPLLATVVLAMDLGGESLVMYATGNILLFKQLYSLFMARLNII